MVILFFLYIRSNMFAHICNIPDSFTEQWHFLRHRNPELKKNKKQKMHNLL